jgi:anti-sigma factor RsiW
MSLTQVILEEIHLYLSGQMTPDELIAFEKKLREDSTLAQEVDLQKRLSPPPTTTTKWITGFSNEK